jgi:hypothetical protein
MFEATILYGFSSIGNKCSPVEYPHTLNASPTECKVFVDVRLAERMYKFPHCRLVKGGGIGSIGLLANMDRDFNVPPFNSKVVVFPTQVPLGFLVVAMGGATVALIGFVCPVPPYDLATFWY